MISAMLGDVFAGFVTNLTPPIVFAAALEAPLAAAAGVNLRLEHDRPAAELSNACCRLGGRGGDEAARNRRAGRREQFLGLIFVNLHAALSSAEKLTFSVGECVSDCDAFCYRTARPLARGCKLRQQALSVQNGRVSQASHIVVCLAKLRRRHLKCGTATRADCASFLCFVAIRRVFCWGRADSGFVRGRRLRHSSQRRSP